MEITIIDFLWIFIIYAVLGWCTEVIYATVNTGRFVNRGFLNGPYCPIYGFGMIAVVFCLTPLEENLLLLFAGAVLLTTALELITGAILERVFNDKWWDYSDEPFNIKGYVCLKFSLLWGLGCLLIVKVVQPLLLKMIQAMPAVLDGLLLSVLFILLAIDTTVTVAGILELQRRLRLLDEIAGQMKEFSDRFGDTLSDGVLLAMEKGDDLKETLEETFGERRREFVQEKRRELEKYYGEFNDLKERYDNLISGKVMLLGRITRAFPRLREGRYREIMEKIRLSNMKK